MNTELYIAITPGDDGNFLLTVRKEGREPFRCPVRDADHAFSILERQGEAIRRVVEG